MNMYIRNEDTICAPATVPGTGAISVIRVSGPEALSIADRVVTCRKGNISDAAGYTIKFGFIYNDVSNCVSNNCNTLPKVKNSDENALNNEARRLSLARTSTLQV